MVGMNNIALNEEVYEQLKDSCESLNYKEPEIDIKDEMVEYIEDLKIEDDHVRESKLKTWIKAKVQPVLTAWERKYSGGDNILNNIHTEIANLDNIKDSEQANIDNLQEQITTEIERKNRKEVQIQKAETGALKNEGIDLKYEKNKAYILIVFSILIAFGTYTLFVKNQISLDWATKSPSTKLTLVQEMVKNGEDAYINPFVQDYFQTDDEKVMSNEQINEERAYTQITDEDLSKVPVPNFTQTLKYNTSLFLLALSAFLLILVGKVTAIVYEKLNNPNWMFYLLYGLAGIVLVSIIVTSSSLTAKEVEKDNIEKSMPSLIVEIHKLQEELSDYDAEEDEYIAIEKKIKPLLLKKGAVETQMKNMDSKIISYTLYVVLLLMFAEVIMGSIAWITYSEFIHKKMAVVKGGKGFIDKLIEEKQKIDDKISTLKNLIDEKKAVIKNAQSLENKIATLEGEIHSKTAIHNISNQHLTATINTGIQMLQKAKARWKREEK